ncbi:hypothetical protein D9758_004252 [Tetrapyrgos nigripes]|uniref:Retrotransposon gag domain-containing protein n=1 Tax=Tetrapyrgos nigripes TaxID=182062 RepID=A0A8H5LVK7_9AGAR|nr:hypothetical protein D9758_004252 [Tetrapyrgos nigripes]
MTCIEQGFKTLSCVDESFVDVDNVSNCTESREVPRTHPKLVPTYLTHPTMTSGWSDGICWLGAPPEAHPPSKSEASLADRRQIIRSTRSPNLTSFTFTYINPVLTPGSPSRPLRCWDQTSYIRSTSALISTATLKTEKNSTTTVSNSLVPTLITPSPRSATTSGEGENSIILPSNPALLRSHFLRLAFSHLPFSGPEFSTSTVPSPDITHTPLPLSAPPSAIPTAHPSPTLAPNPSPLPVSPTPLSPDINMSSATLENLLQALVNNQKQLQQAITNLVNRPTHKSSDKTAKPAPFKGEPAKLDSFLSLFILWAGEQKWLKLDSGKLDPRKCIAEALLMMEEPAAEWAAEYARHISRVRAEEAGAVFPWEGNWDNFTHTLKVRFGVANEQQLAKNKLEVLKQGDKTVTEFSQIFKMWAEKTGFSDQDLQYKFRKRLHKDLFKCGARTEGGS